MEGLTIQEIEQLPGDKPKKIELNQHQSELLNKLRRKKTEPYKIKGKLKDDITAAVIEQKLSMSAICNKFDVNKHSVLRIRKQELGR